MANKKFVEAMDCMSSASSALERASWSGTIDDAVKNLFDAAMMSVRAELLVNEMQSRYDFEPAQAWLEKEGKSINAGVRAFGANLTKHVSDEWVAEQEVRFDEHERAEAEVAEKERVAAAEAAERAAAPRRRGRKKKSEEA
jgi:hypothetical protein